VERLVALLLSIAVLGIAFLGYVSYREFAKAGSYFRAAGELLKDVETPRDVVTYIHSVFMGAQHVLSGLLGLAAMLFAIVITVKVLEEV